LKAGLAALIASLATLSQISGFDATQVKSLNWDIVVMLTPYGLINNFWFHPDSYLRPYYQSPVSSLDPLAAVVSLISAAIALRLIFFLRDSSKK
jgi:hypothetical protein